VATATLETAGTRLGLDVSDSDLGDSSDSGTRWHMDSGMTRGTSTKTRCRRLSFGPNSEYKDVKGSQQDDVRGPASPAISLTHTAEVDSMTKGKKTR